MNEDILHNLNHRIDNALEYSRNFIENEQVIERVEDTRFKAEEYVRQNPVKSVLVGLAAGYILGRLFRSEND